MTVAIHLQGVLAFYEQDWDKALERFYRAIELGSVHSHIMASSLYMSSPCTREKASKAFDYLEVAAEHSIEPAARMLAAHIAGLRHVGEIGSLTDETQACYDEAAPRFDHVFVGRVNEVYPERDVSAPIGLLPNVISCPSIDSVYPRIRSPVNSSHAM